MGSALCGPAPFEEHVSTGQCPVCKSKQDILVRLFEWYGPSCYCLCCGQSWHDGEWTREGKRERAEHLTWAQDRVLRLGPDARICNAREKLDELLGLEVLA